ncbi:MAG: hypothetical protein HLUCCO07_03805 [Rhodobacteraceae bacterium HLUCCO07]|nr:MAG: hypothetical protein HLUCCO07_03805 [Rhodobacteraceae bacterium HLUCCO07]
MIGTALLAIGLILIVEGLVYALAPSLVERMLEALREMPLEARRILGFLAILSGFVLVWVAKLLGA